MIATRKINTQILESSSIFFLSNIHLISAGLIDNPLFLLVTSLVLIALLLLMSGAVSGSEIAFFSLTPGEIDKIKAKKTNKSKLLIKLLEKPDNLLASILISNNFVNIAIIVISTFITNRFFVVSDFIVLSFVIEVAIVSFLILLFGEIIPKIFANYMPVRFAYQMVYPIIFLNKLFSPFIKLLTLFSKGTKKHKEKQKLSIKDISNAFDITKNELQEDKEILEGVASFIDVDLKEILTPRTEVLSVGINSDFKKIIFTINNSAFSRIPVYDNSLDNIKGLLYIKDLITHINKPSQFKWQRLIRPAFFVPETMRANEMLGEFKIRKIHLAIVVDEYGGTSGIITLEDILEEIVGEINDEFDEDERNYTIINDNSFLFDAKISLSDFLKITKIDKKQFSKFSKDAESLAGLIINIKGELPNKNDKIRLENYLFYIEKVDDRRIKEIKFVIENIDRS